MQLQGSRQRIHVLKTFIILVVGYILNTMRLLILHTEHGVQSRALVKGCSPILARQVRDLDSIPSCDIWLIDTPEKSYRYTPTTAVTAWLFFWSIISPMGSLLTR